MSSKALTDKIIRTAQDEAEQITEDAIRRAAESEKIIIGKAETECGSIAEQAKEKAALNIRTAELMSGLDARKAALHARREVIDRAYKEAARLLVNLPDADRLALIKKLIIKYAPEPRFTITLASADSGLLNARDIAQLQAELSGKFGEAEISLAEPSADFCGGVYMTGEKTDVDATYEAIFAELHESCESEVADILFG